ncbi:hypothetical protein CGK66_18330 [Vibrio parahaemolyticus]|nr:hypothetical protein CGK66_18330 [Vibrio parahaemolyticus]
MAFKRSNLAPNQKSESSIKIEETKLVFFAAHDRKLPFARGDSIDSEESPFIKSGHSEEIELCEIPKRGMRVETSCSTTISMFRYNTKSMTLSKSHR